ncbi:MAG TPA: DUF1622 domain-containing protein [Chloroflexia bacterium]|nr:DUF1622 domain-containing protein [Chloroflexia bacterium]
MAADRYGWLPVASGGISPANVLLVEDYLRWATQVVAWVSEIAGVGIAAIGIVRTLLLYVSNLFRAVEPRGHERLRLGLGRSLALALEFLLAADIVRTAVAPTWEEIGQLAAIVAIRTALNFFLQREIAQEARLIDISNPPESPAPAEVSES